MPAHLRAGPGDYHARLPLRMPAPMTAAPPPYLDDDQIERLRDLLERRAIPFGGFDLEALDGFLTALAVAPSLVLPSEWQPVVWGGKTPSWDSVDEALEVQMLLAGHSNMCIERARRGGEDLPGHLAPLLWLPETPDLSEEEQADPDVQHIGHNWALGFFAAVALREEEWESWLDGNDWIDDIFDLLDRLLSGETINPEDPTASAETIDYHERLGIVLNIPEMMADLHMHRIHEMTPRTPIRREAAPGRNDACPCGSGKKYKRCCGAN